MQPLPLLDLDNPRKLEDLYDVGRSIGKGKFSTVFRAKRKTDGVAVALKRVAIFDILDEPSREKCLKEIRLVQSLDHNNIIHFLDGFFENKELLLIFEYADAGDLKRHMRMVKEREARFDERTVWAYFSQIANAVEHMHARRIMHRDLKPANIFLTVAGVIKVGDLGLGRLLSENTLEAHSKVGTPLYMSPEVLTGNGYQWHSDVWSLGCILYELAMLRSPFKEDGISLLGLFEKIVKGEFPPVSEVYSPELRGLVSRMLALDPKARPDAKEVAAIAARMRDSTARSRAAQQAQSSSAAPGDAPPVALGVGVRRRPGSAGVPDSPSTAAAAASDGATGPQQLQQQASMARPSSATGASGAETGSAGAAAAVAAVVQRARPGPLVSPAGGLSGGPMSGASGAGGSGSAGLNTPRSQGSGTPRGGEEEDEGGPGLREGAAQAQFGDALLALRRGVGGVGLAAAPAQPPTLPTDDGGGTGAMGGPGPRGGGPPHHHQPPRVQRPSSGAFRPGSAAPPQYPPPTSVAPAAPAPLGQPGGGLPGAPATPQKQRLQEEGVVSVNPAASSLPPAAGVAPQRPHPARPGSAAGLPPPSRQQQPSAGDGAAGKLHASTRGAGTPAGPPLPGPDPSRAAPAAAAPPTAASSGTGGTGTGGGGGGASGGAGNWGGGGAGSGPGGGNGPTRSIPTLFRGGPEAMAAAVDGAPAAAGAALVEALHWLGVLGARGTGRGKGTGTGGLSEEDSALVGDRLFFLLPASQLAGVGGGSRAQGQLELLLRVAAALLLQRRQQAPTDPAPPAAALLLRAADRLSAGGSGASAPAAARELVAALGALRPGVPSPILATEGEGAAAAAAEALAPGHGPPCLRLLYWLASSALEGRGAVVVASVSAALGPGGRGGVWGDSGSGGGDLEVEDEGQEEGELEDGGWDAVGDLEDGAGAGASSSSAQGSPGASRLSASLRGSGGGARAGGRAAAVAGPEGGPSSSAEADRAAQAAAREWAAEAGRLHSRLAALDRGLAARYGVATAPEAGSSRLQAAAAMQPASASTGGVDWRGHLGALRSSLLHLGLGSPAADGGWGAGRAATGTGPEEGGERGSGTRGAVSGGGIHAVAATLRTLSESCRSTTTAVERMEAKWNPSSSSSGGQQPPGAPAGGKSDGARLILEYRTLLAAQRALQAGADEAAPRVQALSGRLQQTIDETELIGEEMAARTARMSSTAPLQEIRAALSSLRTESMGLELHIGVCQQQISAAGYGGAGGAARHGTGGEPLGMASSPPVGRVR